MYILLGIIHSLLLHRRDFLSQTFYSLSSATLAVVPQDDDDNIVSISERNGQGTVLIMRSVEFAAQVDTLGPLAVYPDPILRRCASPVTRFGPAVDKVANLLLSGMKTNSTTALQYGIDARIIVLKGSASPPTTGSSVPLVLINPNVLSRSSEEKMVAWREYCGDILFPSSKNEDQQQQQLLEVELLRDEVVEVAAQDVRGIPIRKALRGEVARAFQHELDHLNGLLVIDHAELEELPSFIIQQEALYHRDRQRRAFERSTYQGNEPLYW